jgi:hypothetical protein
VYCDHIIGTRGGGALSQGGVGGDAPPWDDTNYGGYGGGGGQITLTEFGSKTFTLQAAQQSGGGPTTPDKKNDIPSYGGTPNATSVTF